MSMPLLPIFMAPKTGKIFILAKGNDGTCISVGAIYNHAIGKYTGYITRRPYEHVQLWTPNWFDEIDNDLSQFVHMAAIRGNRHAV